MQQNKTSTGCNIVSSNAAMTMIYSISTYLRKKMPVCDNIPVRILQEEHGNIISVVTNP